jgi:hypothetical protein
MMADGHTTAPGTLLSPARRGHDEVFASLDDGTARFKVLLDDAALHGDLTRIRTAYVMNDKPISN